MTEKLYWDTPYETSFEAVVLELTPEGIILDKTLFYPEGGNQTSDKGFIIKGTNIVFFCLSSVSGDRGVCQCE